MPEMLKQRVEILAQKVDELEAGGGGGGYTKAEADAKFLSKTDASTDYQTKIADLEAIRSGAEEGATAVQPATLEACAQSLTTSIDNLYKLLTEHKTSAISTWTLGKVLSSYGIIVDNADYGAISDKIQISSYKRIIADAYTYNEKSAICNICQYNNNDEMVGSRIDAVNNAIIFDNSAVYFRISFQFISDSGITVTQNIIDSGFNCYMI